MHICHYYNTRECGRRTQSAAASAVNELRLNAVPPYRRHTIMKAKGPFLFSPPIIPTQILFWKSALNYSISALST